MPYKNPLKSDKEMAEKDRYPAQIKEAPFYNYLRIFSSR